MERECFAERGRQMSLFPADDSIKVVVSFQPSVYNSLFVGNFSKIGTL